ncbi:enhanced ethylene response protein 5-like [Pyrus x bretschneideri]|uniref:enhanced ethylene response protein 5-like n=1 Tax=Pyrus x bretschneideri TaxID=225117 RepID=UPI00202F5AA4|nr:enhanced ethylene response protein 5-like [Pyrus x bretschneideri]
MAMFLHLCRRCLRCHLLQILRVLDRADREMAYLSMGEAHRRITDYLNRFSDADALNVFQDFNRLIKQSDNDSQFGEILVHLFRAFQSYRIGNFIDSYQTYEKPAKVLIFFY